MKCQTHIFTCWMSVRDCVREGPFGPTFDLDSWPCHIHSATMYAISFPSQFLLHICYWCGRYHFQGNMYSGYMRYGILYFLRSIYIVLFWKESNMEPVLFFLFSLIRLDRNSLYVGGKLYNHPPIYCYG